LAFEQDRWHVLDEVYRVYVEFGPGALVKTSEIDDQLDLDQLALERALHWLAGHDYIEWSSTRDAVTITASGIDAIEEVRQRKAAERRKTPEHGTELMGVEHDLRKHILALLELAIKYKESAGLTQVRLSELEHRLGLSHEMMREAIKYLGERGLLKVVEHSQLPYGVSQAFVTDTGKLYYYQLLESGERVQSAPIEIQESLRNFKKDHSDSSKTCFIMMKFGETAIHGRIESSIKNTLSSHGIVGVRSDDKQYHDDLFPNVLTYVHGCGFGVAVFERIESDEFNPNVSLEVGHMLALRKPVCLLKDKTLRILHADLLGKLYREFDTQDPENTIPTELTQWLLDKAIIP
jgi:predicted DNA-binding transcriptional regulator